MHSYRNYVHLEGVALATPVIAESQKYASFQLVVKEEKRGTAGEITVFDQQIEIEVWGRHVAHSTGIRPGTPLVIDGSLRFRTFTESGVERKLIWIKAHRVFALDRTMNKRAEASEDQQS